MKRFLINLAEIHYSLGFINRNELEERFLVALWLSEEIDKDPRVDLSEEDNLSREDGNEEYCEEGLTPRVVSPENHDDEWMEFLCLNKWVFTKSDPDDYPSVPHGHYESQNRKWPKLNPYTGRVFAAKHQEDKSKKLNKKQLKIIWSDAKFKAFCREMVAWYLEENPHYKFAVKHPLRMPKR
jgi:hypothetical protein